MANKEAIADQRRTSVFRPHTPEHIVAIEALRVRYPNLLTVGLPGAVRCIWEQEGLDWREAPAVHFVPDAFLIDYEAREVLLFEVEVTHHLTTKKLRDLGQFWADFDADGHDWLPVLVQVDRFGQQTRRDLSIAYAEVTLTEGAAA